MMINLEVLLSVIFFSIANPQPFEWLNQLAQPYKEENKQQQLMQLINDLAMIFMKAGYEELQKVMTYSQ